MTRFFRESSPSGDAPAAARRCPPESQRNWLGAALRVVLAAALLLMAIYSVGWEKLLAAGRGVPPGEVAMAMLLAFFARLVESWQMSLAMRRAGMNVSPLRVLLANSLASFYGIFLPGDIASGLVKWADLAAATGDRAGVLTAIIYNRLMLLAPWIVAAIVGLVSFSPWPSPWLPPVLIAGGLGCLAFGWTVLHSTYGHRLDRLGRAVCRRWMPQWLNRPFELLADSLQAFRAFPWTLHGVIAGMSLTSMMLTCAAAVLLARAAGLGVSGLVVVWTQSVLVLLRLFPLALQGLGVREVTSLGVLGLFGVPPARAITFSLLAYFNLAMPVTIGAGWQIYRLLRPRAT